jgi:hypothetical protein
VQLRFETQLTSTQYVTQQAWREATLSRCPLHPQGGCGVRRHASYRRVEPVGARVARYYCRRGRTTFRLLPDCLASRLSSSQDEVEQVVVAVEQAASQEAAAAALRPDITLTAAVRWVRRRLVPVRMSVLALMNPDPGAAGLAATAGVRARELATSRALAALRGLAGPYLHHLGPPFGFGPRPDAARPKRRRLQQQMGPDPPSAVR